MKLVSVLMPCYNSELYIRDAIQSILDQTYKNFELLVLDDSSTDETVSIVQSFNDVRIKLFNEANKRGIVHQLNKGLTFSSGEYIARMDSDDISFPNRFQKQLDFLEDHKNYDIDILGTDAVSIGDSSESIIYKIYEPKQISFILNFKCCLLHPTVMLRRRVFNICFEYPNGFLFAEDFAFWRKVDNGSNIAILNQKLLYYRIHSNQTHSNNERLSIQINSAIKCLSIRRIRSLPMFFDYLIINNYLYNKIYIKKWILNEHHRKLNFITRLYIKIRMRQLNLSSFFLNELT